MKGWPADRFPRMITFPPASCLGRHEPEGIPNTVALPDIYCRSAGYSGRFSATVQVGLRPPKHDENRSGHNSRGGDGEIELTSGAIEAEQLFDPGGA